MRRESVFLVVVSLTAMAVNPAQSVVRYNVINLGILEGYPQPEPTSINNEGRVVGVSFEFSGDTTVRATLFDPTGNGNNIDLGTLGGQESVAAFINNRNQIIGAAENDENPPIWCLTVFDTNDSGNNFALFRNASARCINDNGIIAGSVFVSAGQEQVERAALFDINYPNSFTDLGIMSGMDCSEAYSVNNYGQTVGIAYKSENLFEARAVKFDASDPNKNIDLGTLPGHDSATAFCINDFGQIVGRVHLADMVPYVDFAPRAVLFEPTGAGSNIDLGTIAGFENAEAYSINNEGQIVGRALAGEMPYECAVMFDPTGQGKNINLNDRVQTGDDLYLQAATAINDRGWITGAASEPNDKAVAFLLVPLPASEADFEPDGDVDLEDYAILTSAWQSRAGDDNWNPACDISEPPDGIIDKHDLAVLTDSYLVDMP